MICYLYQGTKDYPANRRPRMSVPDPRLPIIPLEFSGRSRYLAAQLAGNLLRTIADNLSAQLADNLLRTLAGILSAQ